MLLLIRLEWLCWAVPVLHSQAVTMEQRVKEHRQALIQIFRRWWRNMKCASVVDHRITTKRNAADANQDFNPDLWVCITLGGTALW